MVHQLSHQRGESDVEKGEFQECARNFVKDEAISSSQLEGAAITTRVARDFLLNRRKPESVS